MWTFFLIPHTNDITQYITKLYRSLGNAINGGHLDKPPEAELFLSALPNFLMSKFNYLKRKQFWDMEK